MGLYLNPGNEEFRNAAIHSKIYVDKTEMIKFTNSQLFGEHKNICVSRPRRFGKSMAANMLVAYYSKGCDSKELFENFKIADDSSFKEHLNKYNVIHLNIQQFLGRTETIHEMLELLSRKVTRELKREFADVTYYEEDLVSVIEEIYAQTHSFFVFIIDEWDCIFRVKGEDTEAQKLYLNFLRDLLKNQPYCILAYMTGILPVKKYGSHSALNMFTEYSMINPREMAEFFGFTEEEVKELCSRYKRNFQEAQAWYDGYELVAIEEGRKKTYSMYSPKSVVDAMLSGIFDNYWNQTETYEALKIYIRMNYDGLKDAVIRMLAGDKVQINTGTFSNDMTTFQGKDDVLTLLVHLGYLSYHWPDKTVTIPNKEVSQEYINAISTMDWKEVIQSVESSRKLLEALWNLDGEAVAKGIDQAHREISVLQYNDENSLSCTINLAFYFAREYYTVIRELPTGKGFADICFIPRKLYADKPAAVIELKWDKDAHGAISQIKEKQYVDALKDYHGNLLLAGINYDKKIKQHTCVIERYHKQ